MGYPNIPFVYFDQVVLPKYEMDAKLGISFYNNNDIHRTEYMLTLNFFFFFSSYFSLAKLGPFYSKQKNSIATQVYIYIYIYK